MWIASPARDLSRNSSIREGKWLQRSLPDSGGALGRTYGREPFVIVTFIFFTLFPVLLLFFGELGVAGAGIRRTRIERIW